MKKPSKFLDAEKIGMDDSNQVLPEPKPALDAASEAALDSILGKWEIVDTEVWAKDALDDGGTAYFTIHDRDGDRASGHWRMIAIEADLDVLVILVSGVPHFEFSWYGNTTSRKRGNGRGWGILKSKDRIEGRFFIHRGDDSGFVAARMTDLAERTKAEAPRKGRP